jgi:hypothetical protein
MKKFCFIYLVFLYVNTYAQEIPSKMYIYNFLNTSVWQSVQGEKIYYVPVDIVEDVEKILFKSTAYKVSRLLDTLDIKFMKAQAQSHIINTMKWEKKFVKHKNIKILKKYFCTNRKITSLYSIPIFSLNGKIALLYTQSRGYIYSLYIKNNDKWEYLETIEGVLE